MMHLTDLAAVGDLAQARGLLVAVDNTFATPFFQRPLELGRRHRPPLHHQVPERPQRHDRRDARGQPATTSPSGSGFIQNAAGAVPGPMDCWLALRGTKTLPLRMRQHDANGRRIAQWLSQHAQDAARSTTPACRPIPQHELACRQMSGFGGMISFDAGRPGARPPRWPSAPKIFALAESLGGVESLIGHPASMTHASVRRSRCDRRWASPTAWCA